MRIAMIAALALALALAAAGCGPTSPTGDGGRPADPVKLLTVLPSPGDLRGAPARAADADLLQRAFTGAPDPALAARVAARNPDAAAVRSWTGPGGRELVVAASVWDSHLVAVGIGGDVSQMLVDREGAAAWTPRDLRGSRGARLESGDRRELRLSLAVGPNSLYVRAGGPVPEDVVVTAMSRMVEVLRGGAADR